MRLAGRARSWAEGLLRRPRVERAMEAELETHLEARAEDLIRQGMPQDLARRRARLDFGSVERVTEECRQARGLGWIEGVAQDLRFGLRMLRKSPALSLAAIVILAAGVGANTAVFSAVNAVLLHPLPYAHSGRLVWITQSLPQAPDNNVSWLDMQDWKRQNHVFQGIAGYSDYSLALTAPSGPPQLVNTRFVSRGYFGVLGVVPRLGRDFTAAEHRRGGAPAAVLAYSLWRQRFGGAEHALGRTVLVNNHAWTIVGVMPAGFGAVTHTQVWLPLEQVVPEENLTHRQYSWGMYAVARLRPGVSFRQANTELLQISRRLERKYPATTGGIAAMQPLTRYIAGDLRPALLLLSTAVLFLLLIACANVASLLLARAVGRRREFTMRRALGAGRSRLFRQMMLESLVLSAAAAALAIPLALGGVRLLAALLPPRSPFAAAVAAGAGSVGLAVGLAAAAGLLFGLGPALLSVRSDSRRIGQSAGARVRGGTGRAHQALVVAEVGLAAALLAGAGLMWGSMTRLLRVAPGFNTHHLLDEDLVWNLPGVGAANVGRVAQTLDPALARISALPGVVSAGIGFPAPFTPQISDTYVAIDGRPPVAGKPVVAHFGCASPGYFRTLRIPLIEGRVFTRADRQRSRPVAVIDAELARRYWPGQNPVGRQIKLAVANFADPAQPALTIVGVVGTVKAGGLDADLGGYVYRPYTQSIITRQLSVMVRTTQPPLSLARPVAAALRAAAPSSPIAGVATMRAMASSSQATRELCLRLLAGFALAALVLAMLGVYGVTAYTVERSANEIGVRMALGAKYGQILGLVLGRGARLAALGAVCGLAAAFGLTRFMAALLYGVGARDPRTFAAVAVAVFAMVMLACWLPARRAAAVDPVSALRCE